MDKRLSMGEVARVVLEDGGDREHRLTTGWSRSRRRDAGSVGWGVQHVVTLWPDFGQANRKV